MTFYDGDDNGLYINVNNNNNNNVQRKNRSRLLFRCLYSSLKDKQREIIVSFVLEMMFSPLDWLWKKPLLHVLV